MTSEVVISLGPRNEFLELFIAMLGEVNIPGRAVPLSAVPSEIRPQVVPMDYEPYFVLVPEHDEQASKDLLQHLIYRSKICLECQAIIRPDESACKKCGALADSRDPDEIREAYHAAWLEQERER